MFMLYCEGNYFLYMAHFERYIPDFEDKAAAEKLQKWARTYGVSNETEDPANSELSLEQVRKEQQERKKEERERQKELERSQEQASALTQKNALKEQWENIPRRDALKNALNSSTWPPVFPENTMDASQDRHTASYVGGTEMPQERSQA